MGIFFNDPVLGRLEKLMWEIAEQEVKSQLDPDVLNTRKASKEIKIYFKSIFSEERKKAKMAIKTYKKLSPNKINEALKVSIAESNQEWYSIENQWSTGVPVLLAVPYNVLSEHVTFNLDQLFSERIEFSSLLERARLAFAIEAVDKFLKNEVHKYKKNKTKIKAKSFYPYSLCIVDLLENDYYRIGDDETACCVDMVIINTDATPDAWEKTKNDVNARPQSRCYTDHSRSNWKSL